MCFESSAPLLVTCPELKHGPQETRSGVFENRKPAETTHSASAVKSGTALQWNIINTQQGILLIHRK